MDKNYQVTYQLREKIKKYQTDVQKLNKPDYLIETIAKITNYKIDFYLNQSDDIDSKLRDLNDNEISLIKIFRKLFKELNTYLSLPSLVRLYENGDFKLYFNFFKALTAFFVLRRSATIETDQIDNIFRNLMFGQNKLDFCGLKTNLDKSNELPDLNIIKNYLINNLNNSKVNFNLESKKEWVSHMINVPIYDRKILSKFLLFAAYNNTITEEKTGLVTRRGVTPDISRSFLKFENFQSKIYETVEHVAPQSPNNPDSWRYIF